MRCLKFKDIRRFVSKNSYQIKTNNPIISKFNFKSERRKKMNNNIVKNTSKAAVMLAILFSFALTGCGDSNVAGVHDNESKITASGEKLNSAKPDSTSIRLDLSLKFKSGSITDSKNLESNIGNRFNHIASIDIEIKPNEELDLQEIQPRGIFGLYLSGTGSFTLTNSDGMSFTSKTILMEKCAFIDLKLRNQEQTSIHISGFVAGE